MTPEDIERIYDTVRSKDLIRRTDIPFELIWEELKYRKACGRYVNQEEDWGLFV